MTLFELMGALCGLVGAVSSGLAASQLLHGRWHTPGIIVGGLAGLVVGYLVGFLGMAFIFDLSVKAEERRARRVLVPRFGDYLAADRAEEWRRIRATFVRGQEVSGEVLSATGQIWIDLRCGFPAGLLAAVRHDGAVIAPRVQVREAVRAFVFEVSDEERKVILVPVDPSELRV